MKLLFRIPPKPPFVVLQDTVRLLRDIAKLHPSPDYVLSYAADLERVTKQLRQEFQKLDRR